MSTEPNTTTQKVLIVDDEPTIRKLLATLVGTLGPVEIVLAADGREALAKAAADPPDLVIADVNMPHMDGVELCRTIREDARLAGIQVLLVTAKSDAQDRYEGLAVGADDYIVKPFDPIEVQLRVKTHLRRAAQAIARKTPPGETLVAGPLRLEPRRSSVTVGELELRLTAAEFAILRCLAENADRLVTAADLLERALHYPLAGSNPAIIHTHMRNLRAKFRQVGLSTDFLASSRQGYMLVTD